MCEEDYMRFICKLPTVSLLELMRTKTIVTVKLRLYLRDFQSEI